MTVYIEKPAVNLRSELASLRNQGGYQEQQFWFDGLVTNGTFDSSTVGWSGSSATLSIVSGALRVTATASYGTAYQAIPVEIGKTYSVSVTSIAGTAAARPRAGYSVGDNSIWQGSTTTSGSLTETFTFTASNSTLFITLYAQTTVVGQYADYDNVSVFETDGTDVVHRMPKGWKPKDVFEDGLLQREGAAHDYEVVYDGFDYYVKPAVAPSATTQTCVIGVKA